MSLPTARRRTPRRKKEEKETPPGRDGTAALGWEGYLEAMR